MESPGGVVATYTYNALQQRVGRDVDGEITQFLWDGVNLRQESQAGVVEVDYTLAPQPEPQPYGDLVSQRREMESSFYHFDALGSTRALTDAGETVTDEATYRAFGETAAASGTTANPFGWVGKPGYYRDEETGLLDLDRRKHDPVTGAFTTEDPRGFEAGDSNFYRYVGNNPATKIDPSGLEEASSPPRAARELAGAIQRRDAAQLYALYAAWKRGILYGVFVDGGWGTLKSIPEMAWEAVEWNQWLREAQYAALTDPLGFAQRRREELDRTRTVIDQVRKLTPDELRHLMTGDISGLEGKVDADLLEISGALGEALNDLQRHLIEELSAEDAAYAMGRIYGAVAFEVTLAVGTGGAAAALKAGKLARIVGRLRKIRGLNTPTGERLLKRLTDAADAVHESVRKSARGETLGSGPGGLGDLGTGKRAGAEGGGVAPNTPAVPKTGETASTAIGKDIHKKIADARRASGEFDLVQSPITDKSGNPILVSKRVHLATGKPQAGSPLQEAVPDAVSFERRHIVDDKPLGRPVAKDRQEIVRHIKAYEQREGHLPTVIGITRYDPQTGQQVLTELYSPNEFLP